MDDLGTLNLEEEAKQNENNDNVLEKGRLTNGSKNELLFSNRYTIVDNNFEEDDNRDSNFNFNKSNEENGNINDTNRNTEMEQNDNIIENKLASRESNKNKKNLINIKIILLGNVSVGKTCIIGRYINNSFSDAYKSTIQAEQSTKIINEDDDTSLKLIIWDTVGQEKFRSITRQYYRDALGAIIVFDLTDKKSFDDVNSWLKDLNTHGSKDTVIIILGNKSDLSGQRVVTQEEIKEAFDKNYLYFDVSAKNGNNISLAFDKLKKMIMENLKKNENLEGYNNNIKENETKVKKKKLNNGNTKKTQSLDDIGHNLKKEKDKKCC